MSAAARSAHGGLTPFFWFGIAVVLGAAYAMYMGLAYYNVPTFTTSALPTIAGVAIAVVIFLVIGALAPSNE